MRTFQLLFGGGGGGTPNPGASEVVVIAGVSEGIFGGGAGSVVVTEQIREWDYGEYEGMKAAEVRELRKQRGLETEGVPRWSVWRDGCEGGESVSYQPGGWSICC
jgi:broad specificity phosphatase PhoE